MGNVTKLGVTRGAENKDGKLVVALLELVDFYQLHPSERELLFKPLDIQNTVNSVIFKMIQENSRIEEIEPVALPLTGQAKENS